MSVSSSGGAGAVVLGAGVRVLADVLQALFERDRQLAGALNAQQRRLLLADQQMIVSMPVGAVLLALGGSAGADLSPERAVAVA